eukprot:3248056-Pleurochrysis_carterae.AAC.1
MGSVQLTIKQLQARSCKERGFLQAQLSSRGIQLSQQFEKERMFTNIKDQPSQSDTAAFSASKNDCACYVCMRLR